MTIYPAEGKKIPGLQIMVTRIPFSVPFLTPIQVLRVGESDISFFCNVDPYAAHRFRAYLENTWCRTSSLYDMVVQTTSLATMILKKYRNYCFNPEYEFIQCYVAGDAFNSRYTVEVNVCNLDVQKSSAAGVIVEADWKIKVCDRIIAYGRIHLTATK